MIPEPKPSLVISYYYLWQHEEKTGQENGTKNRPCLILSAESIGKTTRVIVAPITHTKPLMNEAVEIPRKVKIHLGMDEEPSYIICTEVNEFIWPGFDLGLLDGESGKFVYGFLPSRLFDAVKEKIHDLRQNRKLKVVSRND